MDVVTYTQHKRLDILNYIKPILSFESYSWVQSLFNDINKKMVVEKDDAFSAGVLSMYQNILDFFQQYIVNLNAGSILFTFYMCSLELGVRGYNDSVTTLKEFTDYIDTSNISELNIEHIVKIDSNTLHIITGKYLGQEMSEEIWTGGLLTLNAIGYYRSCYE
jgi:hypothetical protein